MHNVVIIQFYYHYSDLFITLIFPCTPTTSKHDGTVFSPNLADWGDLGPRASKESISIEGRTTILVLINEVIHHCSAAT
jgi:hypothetical protein